jgi:hypothetical protein
MLIRGQADKLVVHCMCLASRQRQDLQNLQMMLLEASGRKCRRVLRSGKKDGVSGQKSHVLVAMGISTMMGFGYLGEKRELES